MRAFVRFRSGWAFFNALALICAVWIAWNALPWSGQFDPYPFVFFTLVLSVEASLSTALVMMELNRQSEGDRKLLRQALELNVQIVSHVKTVATNVAEMASDLDELLRRSDEILQQLAA